MPADLPLKIREIAAAFGLNGEPEALPGGQGTSIRVGNGVLKPTDNPVESAWIAEVYSELSGPGFTVPKPLAAGNEWSVDGWTAWQWLPGEHLPGRWPDKIATCLAFHKALAGHPCPAWMGSRDNAWEEADHMVWGESPLDCHPRIRPSVDRLLRLIRPTEQTSQLIHGDFGGNVLFLPDGPPAVIDFSPYWRPATFAVGVVIADAIVWEGADPSIFDLVADLPEIGPLTARAELRRILELDRHFRRGRPILDDIDAHLPFIELLETIVARSGIE